MFGDKMSKVFEDIEETLWEIDAATLGPQNYTDKGFRGAVKIFSSVIMDRMWVLQEKEKMDLETRKAMAVKAGESIRNLIKVYTDIDPVNMYKEESEELNDK